MSLKNFATMFLLKKNFRIMNCLESFLKPPHVPRDFLEGDVVVEEAIESMVPTYPSSKHGV